MQAQNTIQHDISVSADRLLQFNKAKIEKEEKLAKQRLKQEKKEAKKLRKETKKKKGKGIDKTSIGGPQNFRLISHSGLDGNYEAEDLPREYKIFLRNCGISKSDWKDPEKKQQIVEKVNEVLREERETKGDAAVEEDLKRITSVTNRPRPAQPPATPPPTRARPPATPPPSPISRSSRVSISDSTSDVSLGRSTEDSETKGGRVNEDGENGDAATDSRIDSTTSEDSQQTTQETKTEDVPASDFAAALSGVKLRKAAPKPQAAQASGRDATLDLIRLHPGVNALKKVQSVEVNHEPPSANSLEDSFKKALFEFRGKVGDERDDGDESSDWSTDED